jgi:hypothetical protein
MRLLESLNFHDKYKLKEFWTTDPTPKKNSEKNAEYQKGR